MTYADIGYKFFEGEVWYEPKWYTLKSWRYEAHPELSGSAYVPGVVELISGRAKSKEDAIIVMKRLVEEQNTKTPPKYKEARHRITF